MGKKLIIAVSLLSPLLLATASAAEPQAKPEAKPVIDPATYQPRTEHDNTPWRFDMEQDGKRMTADQFDAWMKARGVRVATGKPAEPKGGAPIKQVVADE